MKQRDGGDPAEWPVAQPDLETALRTYPAPLEALASGEIAAVVLRNAFPVEACRQLVQRLLDRSLLYDPRLPIPEKFVEQSIPEGYYREGKGRPSDEEHWRRKTGTGRRRIDVGASLGYRGSNPDEFFAHAQQAIALFESLFAGHENPIDVCYRTLERLSIDKRVLTAREADGRLYGPAIIRAHYGGYTYKPHFDSVRLREKRADYAVHEFAHQFAGVLVLQNTQLADRSAQSVLHRCFWSPDVDHHLQADSFHDYARRQRIPNVQIVLDPGDLYFFNTGLIHEVPGVAGELPRIVLATFIGYSPDRPEIYVWS